MVPPLVMLALLRFHRRRRRKRQNGISVRDDTGGANRDTGGPNRSPKDFSRNSNTYPETLCRICLKEGSIPIFGEKDISDTLNTFADIQVRLDDNFPKYICQLCNTLLEGAILLKETAQCSDQTLRSPVQSLDENNESKITKNNIKEENLTELNTADKVEDCDTQNDSTNDFEDIFYFNKETLQESSDCESKFKTYKKLEECKLPSHPEDDNCIYQCEQCTIVFETQQKLVKHTLLHTRSSGRIYYCKICNIEFKTIVEYRQHRLSDEHAIARKTCPYCNKSYRTTSFRTHLLTHTQGRIYMCDVCGKKYNTLGQVNRHRETHFLKSLPFKCTLCPYKGRFNASLKSHMRYMHSKTKPYECQECHQFFSSLNNFKRHLLTHKSVRDFQCNQCQRGFHKKLDLDRHYKVDHNGIKEHICNLCGKAFGYRRQMRKHEVKFHKLEKKKLPGRTPLYRILETQQQLEGQQSND